MVRRFKTYLAILAVALLAIGASNGYTYFRAKAFWHAQGVLECQIANQSATELLNAALDAARAKTSNAALDAEMRRRELTELERELADERARDPLADGQCISPDGLRRVFRVD